MIGSMINRPRINPSFAYIIVFFRTSVSLARLLPDYRRREPPSTGIASATCSANMDSDEKPALQPRNFFERLFGPDVRILIPSMIAGYVGGAACLLSNRRKVPGCLEASIMRFITHTAAYTSAREIVRFNRVGDPDDLLNSIVGGVGGGACHGFLRYRRIGLAGVGRYAAMYSVVGTAADYATSGIRSAFDRHYATAFEDFRRQRINRKDL